MEREVGLLYIAIDVRLFKTPSVSFSQEKTLPRSSTFSRKIMKAIADAPCKSAFRLLFFGNQQSCTALSRQQRKLYDRLLSMDTSPTYQ